VRDGQTAKTAWVNELSLSLFPTLLRSRQIMLALDAIPTQTLLLIARAFLGDGLSKGLVRVGLPLVSLPFLA